MSATFVNNGRARPSLDGRRVAGTVREPATGGMRVLVFADEPLAGQALCALLSTSRLVAEARYAARLEDWREAVHAHQPNTILWLGTYADRAKIEIVGAIRERFEDIAVCLVTERVETVALRDVIRNGAERLGVVLRDPELHGADVVKSLVQLAAGRATLSPEILEQLVTDARADADCIDTLSHAEHRVLSLLASGLRNREIARRLRVSEKLVERHVTRIFCKLGLRQSGCEELDRRVMAARMFFLGPERNAHGERRYGDGELDD